MFRYTLETIVLTQSAKHWSKVLYITTLPTDGSLHRNQWGLMGIQSEALLHEGNFHSLKKLINYQKSRQTLVSMAKE